VHCLRSLGSRDRKFESHTGHGCLVFVYVCVFFCVCVQVGALRRADHPSKESYRLSLIKKLRKLSPMLQKREKRGRKKTLNPIHSTCPAHRIVLDLIILIILSGAYMLRCSSLCSFLQPPVTSSPFGQNIVLNTLFSNTTSLCFSHNVKDQVSHPYKTAGKIKI
jgi:hypothetical protein